MERVREVPACSCENMIYIASDARKPLIISLSFSLYVASYSCQNQLTPSKKQNKGGKKIDHHLSADRRHSHRPKGLMILCLSLPLTHTLFLSNTPKFSLMRACSPELKETKHSPE